jgi:hypothetical protein
MPEGIGYGDDATEELIRLATDPTFDVADPATIGALQQGVPQPGAASPTMDYRINPSYAAGGMVSAAGPQPQAGLAPQGAQQGAPIPMQQMQAEMQRMAQQHPEEIMKIKQIIETGMQAGEVTPQELNMAVQLATRRRTEPPVVATAQGIRYPARSG